jgi:hypothetical protein
MAQDERRKERSANPVERKPAAQSRVIVLTILAMQALASHGSSAVPGMDLNVTSNRVGVLRACGQAEVTGARPGESPTEGPGTKR